MGASLHGTTIFTGLAEAGCRCVEDGLSRRQAAERFKVAVSTVIEWIAAWRAEGRLAAKPMGGDHSSRLTADRDWLLARIAAAPDLTGQALRAELAKRGTKVSYDTVWRFLREERLTFKKKPARRRAGPPRRRPQARAVEALPALR